MKLSLFDLHCDTAHRMLTERQPLSRNSFAVSLENARIFESYTQVMALWPDPSLNDDESWTQVLSMLENLKKDASILEGNAQVTTEFSAESPVSSLLLSVEDVRILAGKAERLETLWHLGVRVLTPLWKGNTCIGGSHDTTNGLTPFGKEVLRRAAELGFILDVSHASERSANEIFEIGEAYAKPVIASHSNAFAVCPVSRNLKRDQIERIVSAHGLIGLNLHTPFIKHTESASAEDLLLHIEHFLSLGASSVLSLGCDMDGCDLPMDIPNIATLPRLAEQMLRHGYSEELIRKVFFENAAEFAKKHLTSHC